MRSLLLSVGMICAGASVAQAQGMSTPSSSAIVIRHDDAAWRSGCAWVGTDGKWKLAVADGKDPSKEVPSNASCWQTKSFEFPGASVAEVHFTKKGVKTPVEFHAVDTFLYVEDGHAHNMVEGVTMDLGPGDAAFQNAGAWHQNESTSDDYTQIELKVPHAATDSNNPAMSKKGLDIDRFPRQVGALIHNADIPLHDVCEVKKGGETKMVGRSPETASSIPKDALCLSVKAIMSRPSGRLIELTLPKGMKTEPHQNTAEDTLFRLIKGHAHFDGGGQSSDLKPGDIVYVPTGALHTFTAREDTKLLEIQYVPLAAR